MWGLMLWFCRRHGRLVTLGMSAKLGIPESPLLRRKTPTLLFVHIHAVVRFRTMTRPLPPKCLVSIAIVRCMCDTVLMSDHDNPSSERPRFNVHARLKSFFYAGRGLRLLVQEEHNAWLHLTASAAVIGAGIVLKVSLDDWRWLVIAVALVWVAEAINTAVEELCDRVSPEFDPSVGRVKDIAAGGVLAASMAAAVIGLLTLGPPFLKWFE